MPDFILIKNGVVENVIIAEQDVIDSLYAPLYDHCIVRTPSMRVGPGDLYRDGVFSKQKNEDPTDNV